LKRLGKTGYSIIALALVLALAIQTVVFAFGNGKDRPADIAADTAESEDMGIAADISNLTGATTGEVMQLKQSGLDWNEVLDRLKAGNGGSAEQRETRSGLLAESGMEDIVAKLRASGFGDGQIQEAKMLAERVGFQLEEIASGTGAAQPAVPVPGESDKDAALDTIRQVAERYEPGSALYYMLELQEELGSQEAVLNEYLLALQIGIDLEDYVRDREAYEQAKEEKLALLKPSDRVTVSSVEEAMLERYRQSPDWTGDTASEPGAMGAAKPDGTKADSPLPDAPVPEVRDVHPVNPGEQLRQELEALNPNLP
jgi:hypothetical protein